MQLQDDLADIEAAGIQLVGISPDSVEILKKFADARSISFPLLADAGSETINAYGLHYQKGLPHPGTVIIDSTGTVRGKIFREGYRDRHPTVELVDAAKALK